MYEQYKFNSLIEDIVSSVQNLYMHTADKVSPKVRKCKSNYIVYKNKQWFNKKSSVTEVFQTQSECWALKPTLREKCPYLELFWSENLHLLCSEMAETWNFPKPFQIETHLKLQSLVFVVFTGFELLKFFRVVGKNDAPFPGLFAWFHTYMVIWNFPF